MTTSVLSEPQQLSDKGLKGGSLGLVAVIVIGVASTAPATVWRPVSAWSRVK